MARAIKNVTPPEELALVKTEPLSDEAALVSIADDIRAEFGKGIDAQFRIGHLLSEAAARLDPSARYSEGPGKVGKGSPFGDWFRAQNFPFSDVTAWRLRKGAEREEEVRAFISQVSSVQPGRDLGVTTAMALIDKPADDRQPREAVKALQELVGPDKETSAFTKFVAAVEALDLSQLPDDELIAVANYVKALAVTYNAERAARAERE